jgi:hypothetical protein
MSKNDEEDSTLQEIIEKSCLKAIKDTVTPEYLIKMFRGMDSASREVGSPEELFLSRFKNLPHRVYRNMAEALAPYIVREITSNWMDDIYKEIRSRLVKELEGKVK